MVSLHTETAKYKWEGLKNEFCFLMNTLGFSILFVKQFKWMLLVLNIKKFDGYKSSCKTKKSKLNFQVGPKYLTSAQSNDF